MVSFNDPDEFYETMAAGGNAMRLKDIKGVGPKTANKINNVRGVNSTDDITDMSADELSDKANISRKRASKAIKGLGGNPSVSKRGNLGSVSAAGISTRQGDFWTEFADLDKARARNDPRSRSKEAVRMDEKRRAPITTDLEKWKQSPGEYDYPGVDTPTQDPQVRPKDYKRGGPFETSEFDAQGSAEYDDQGSEYPKRKPAASGKENFILDTGEDRIPASEVSSRGKDVDDFGVFAEALDISLAPDEAFGGTAVVSDRELGGNVLGEGERAPSTEPEKPPEQALRAQSRGDSDSVTVSLPAWTVSRGQTYLNEEVYGNEREDLRETREKLARADENQPIQFERGEYQQFKTVVEDHAKEEMERAERMEANIFGDTDKQADVAEEALQGLYNNPPDF